MKKSAIKLTLLFPLLMLILSFSSCQKEEQIQPESILEPGITYSTFTDSRDGHLYHTIKIGDQTWMAENLAYRIEGCWAYDIDYANVEIYGYLYDWETACDICPEGWHLPSSTEFHHLIKHLGGIGVAGGKLKRSGLSYWDSPNTGATNSSGFTALASGMSYSGKIGYFERMGSSAYFWSSTELENQEEMIASNRYVWYLFLHYNMEKVGSRSSNNGLDRAFKSRGFSIRCVKD